MVKAKTWELVDITCLTPVLVIGIYCVVNHLTEEGTHTATKLNDNLNIPVVRSKSFHNVIAHKKQFDAVVQNLELNKKCVIGSVSF